MKAWNRYLFIQIPGWILAGLVLWALHHWVNLPAWAAAGLFLIYTAKDLIVYPFVRSAYEDTEIAGAAQLLGTCGIVKKELNPEGYIQIRGELWRARAAPKAGAIPQGRRVKVQATEGLVLIVSSLQDEECDSIHLK